MMLEKFPKNSHNSQNSQIIKKYSLSEKLLFFVQFISFRSLRPVLYRQLIYLINYKKTINFPKKNIKRDERRLKFIISIIKNIFFQKFREKNKMEKKGNK